MNSAPVAVNDTLPDVNADGQPVLISVSDLLGNDTDVDHDQLTITGVGSAVGGTVTIDKDGIHFVPASGFTGEASFQYTISDGQGGTSTAEASFTVKPEVRTSRSRWVRSRPLRSWLQEACTSPSAAY